MHDVGGAGAAVFLVAYRSFQRNNSISIRIIFSFFLLVFYSHDNLKIICWREMRSYFPYIFISNVNSWGGAIELKSDTSTVNAENGEVDEMSLRSSLGNIFDIIKIVGELFLGSIGIRCISETYLGPTRQPRLNQMTARPERNFLGQGFLKFRTFGSRTHD